MLRNSYVTKYIEDHPAAYDEVVTAVQKIPRPKSLPTPASTPCYTGSLSEQTSTSLPSQHITQEEELDSDDQTDQYENLFESHDHNSPAVRQELNHKSRRLYQVYAENGDDSEPEQTTSDSQRSANLGVWPPTDHNDDIYDRDACQESQLSGQTATSLAPHLM
jgi:uncharacterized membrane-anchored protein YhcB (DUF1043 family)